MTKPYVPELIPPSKWAKMSKKARLLAIAQDILAQLRRKKHFTPTTGTYMNEDTHWLAKDRQENTGQEYWFRATPLPSREVQETLLQEFSQQCKVCAIGAAWVSRVRLANGVDGKEFDHYDSIRDEIGYTQARDIEAAFEVSGGSCWDEEDKEDCEDKINRAMRFGARYKDPTKRLRAIMKNVVENGGVFRP